ncbi:MAG TPA: CHAT domain-containing tetratricopeptide repeat protein [Terriglobia bacterium]|nr:CHAT domain-containing tetratricopeptide repeat protein [Terriglobia bacterium]
MSGEQRETLRETFERFWAEIRGAQLYAGQPRSTQSSAGVNLAQEALRLATASGDEELLLDAWRMLAYSLSADERWLDAIPYYEKAISGYESRGEHAFAARKLRIGFVSALMLAGRYEDALKAAAIAEHWLKASGDNEGYARLCTNLANLHQRLDQYQASCDYYAKALQVFESAGDQRSAALIYQNLGYPLGRLDRFEEADAMYVRAEQLASELGMQELGVQSSYNRAYLFFLRGRYSEALQSFARVRAHFRDSGSLMHFGLCDLDEAEIYLQLNITSDASTLAQSASRQFKQIGMVYEEAKALAFHGVALMQMSRLAEALETFRASQQAFESEGNRYWVAVLDLYRADVYLQLQRYWEAHSLAAQARQRFEALAIPSRRMLSLVILGRISLSLNDIAAAQKNTEEIAAITEQEGIPLLRFPYFVLCGQIAERKQDWARAEESFRLAAEDLETHQSRLQHDDLKVTFLRGRNQVYESLVRLGLENSREPVETAYSWCERAKSRGLVELLSHHLPSVQLRGEQSLLRRVHRLREELNLQYVRSRPETGAVLSSPEFDAVVLKEQELARTLREVAADDPEYVSLQQVSPLKLEQVQEFISPETTLIEYFITQDEVIAFVVTRNDAKVFRHLAPPSRIRGLQERLSFQLEKFFLGPEYVKAHSDRILEGTKHHLSTLYAALIEPLAAELRTPQLTIVPHGMLHFLPFHAFFDGERYLIDRFEIAYAPSASVLRYCAENQDVDGASPLIVGVADELAPMVDEEVRMLSTLFPGGRTISGADATRAAFSDAARTASFIHIATHANFRQDNPMFSSFKLADGYVTALDLFSMSCRTNMVALSGCQSGLAEVSGSDDLLGLVRGFLYAGARSLLLSLWSVNDESTALLMGEFYKAWQGGENKAKALQTAIRNVRRTHPHPFHWAPFILVGKV